MPAKLHHANLGRKTDVYGVNLGMQCVGLMRKEGNDATPADIETIYEYISSIDPSLDCSGSLRKSVLSNNPEFKKFYNHCCRQRHYFFEICKYNCLSCEFCLPIRLPEEIFCQLKLFPDPTPSPVDGTSESSI